MSQANTTALSMHLLRPIFRSMISEVGRVRSASEGLADRPLAIKDAMLDIEDCLASLSDLTEGSESDPDRYSTFDINCLTRDISSFSVRKSRLSQAQRLVYGDYEALSRAAHNLRRFFVANDSGVNVTVRSHDGCMYLYMQPRSTSPALKAALGRWVIRGFNLESITEDGLRPLYSHRLAVAHLMFSSGGAKMTYDSDSMEFVLEIKRSQQLQLEI